MREGIHPNYYQATVTCNCGNTFVTGPNQTEIPGRGLLKGHSFYNGQEKVRRIEGRIEKFNKKYGIKN